MKIVVVDDEPTIVLMCRRVLEAQGHIVQGFTSAQAALAQLETDAADLLVVDYKMPELNGLEFIQKAWALRPSLRVVMITAHGTREVISRATQTGVSSIVLKPFTPTELTRGVTEAASDPRPRRRERPEWHRDADPGGRGAPDVWGCEASGVNPAVGAPGADLFGVLVVVVGAVAVHDLPRGLAGLEPLRWAPRRPPS